MGAPSAFSSFYFQLEDEGASSSSSSPFHPFETLNRRVGIYTSPLSFPPQHFDSHRTPTFLEAEKQLIEEFKLKDCIMSSSSESSVDNIPLSARMTGKKRVRDEPDSHISLMRDWSDDEVIPTKLKELTISDSEGASSNKDTSSSKGASSPLNESEFDRRVPESREFSISPQKSDIPFKHWEPTNEELDFDWKELENQLSDHEKNVWRRKEKKLACVGTVSTVSDFEIDWSMKYYDMEGIWARPLSKMRPHIFNNENLKIPRMVLTPKLLSLGVGAPLHPFIKKILKWFDLAPIQLSPNSYKLSWDLFIMYHDLELGALSMKEFSFFFSLRKSSPGYYYLVANKQHNKKGFSEGKVSHERGWKEPFFYLYDVKRCRVRFNTEPSKDIFPLQGAPCVILFFLCSFLTLTIFCTCCR